MVQRPNHLTANTNNMKDVVEYSASNVHFNKEALILEL